MADTLRQLHGLTQDWPQRPGWRSSTDLLRAKTGTRVDLDAMPSEGVVRCRAAWARLAGRERCVIHGDTNPGNIRMTADRVTLIDWDEAHVDVPDLDLVLPYNAAGLDDDAHDVAAQAKAAWEAAVCWDPSGTDEFAVRPARRGSTGLSRPPGRTSAVETMGLEPTTSCLQSRCSSQLSYVPEVIGRPIVRFSARAGPLERLQRAKKVARPKWGEAPVS